MGRPAATLLSTTAHGGIITGPGCPTVLIGKKPAARMTDMHVCPMVTGVVPHVGGPHIGPVPPTVFIGKLPAACAGDMLICTGPPSTILPPGCPTVLIGSSGAGGGSGGGSGGGGSSSSQTLRAAKAKKAQGTEALPIDVQMQIAQAARYQTPEETELLVNVLGDSYTREGSGGNAQESDQKQFTLKDVVEILKEVEHEEGYEAARHFASYLDYSVLTTMAMSGTDGNDPNQMPTRFMLLHGMDDDNLQQKDDHPDRFGEEEHTVTVSNLRKALRLLGYKVAEKGAFDDGVLAAHAAYLCTAWRSNAAPQEKHVVAQRETLGSIAHAYGLASWKYLYEKNKDAVGDNPDLLMAGTELVIPTWDCTSGEAKIRQRGANPFSYTGGLRYAYPWVAYSVTLVKRSGEAREAFEEDTPFVVADDQTGVELARGTMKNADEIELLVPDARRKSLAVAGVEYV
jgi:uncharacterized Zn-binding protein involved in type VI secretion